MRARSQFKDDVVQKYQAKNNSPFKHLFRSKGFIWVSNYPNNYFEWSQAAIQLFIEGAIPWEGVASDPNMSLEDQAKSGNLGKRQQNLVFIGQHMSE